MTSPMLAETETAFTFIVPETATATEPPEYRGIERDAVRLLVARPSGISHRVFRQLPAELRAGDVLVVNTSQTVPAEIDGRWRDEPVVVHLGTPLAARAGAAVSGAWVVELRTAPDGARPILDAAPGDTVNLPDGSVLVLVSPYPHGSSSPASSPIGAGNRVWRATGPGQQIRVLMAENGRPIAYGYLRGRYPLSAYQTTFGIEPGSAEMPRRPLNKARFRAPERSGHFRDALYSPWSV
jgi:S-adenosylmethionine:tRNA ribosyltransferase-isomerase